MADMIWLGDLRDIIRRGTLAGAAAIGLALAVTLGGWAWLLVPMVMAGSFAIWRFQTRTAIRLSTWAGDIQPGDRLRSTVWVAVVLGALVLALMGELDTLLQAIRNDGVPARSIGWLTTTLDGDAVSAAVADMRRFDAVQEATAQEAGQAKPTSALSVVWLFVAIDSVAFIATYLCAALPYLHNRQQQHEQRQATGIVADEDRVGRALRWAVNALFALVAIDWLENLGLGAHMSLAWMANGDDTGSLGEVLRVLTSGLWVAKWAMVATVAYGVIIERRLTRPVRLRALPANRARISVSAATRPVMVVTLSFLALLIVPIQISDVLLGLGEFGRPLAAAIGALAILSMSNAVTAAVLVEQTDAPTENATKSFERQRSVGTIALGVLVLAGGLALRRFAGWGPVVIFPGALIAVVGFANAVSSGGVAAADDEDVPTWSNLFGPGLFPAFAGVLRWLRDSVSDGRSGSERAVTRGHNGIALLTAAPWWILGGAMIRAGFGDAVFFRGRNGSAAACAVGIGLVVVGGLLYVRTKQVTPNLTVASLRRWRMTTVGLVVGLGIGSFWAVSSDPVRFGRSAGATALLVVFLSVLTVGLGALGYMADRTPTAVLFSNLGFKRWPLLGAMVLWLIVGIWTFPREQHDLPGPLTMEASDVDTPECVGDAGVDLEPAHLTVDTAFAAWLATNNLPVAPSASADDASGPGDEESNVGADDRAARPLVIVAASGGGVRAAWWAAAVMGELAPTIGDEVCATSDGADSRVVFATSGISGGSVGLATHQAGLVTRVPFDDEYRWVEDRLGVDHLSPTLAWMTYVESPQLLLGFPTGRDRGEVMELSWREPWGSASSEEPVGVELGLRQTWFENPHLPLPVLAAASVGDGCRIYHSPLSETVAPVDEDVLDCTRPGLTFPQAYGLDAVLCDDQDIRLSSAALNSARFPLVTPSGRLPAERCDGDADPTTSGANAIEAVDGGYLDANGAEAAADLWDRVEPLVERYNQTSDEHCIVPVFVQLIDDFAVSVDDDISQRMPTLLGPLESVLSARAARTGLGDERMVAAFTQITETDVLEASTFGCADAQPLSITIQPAVSPGANPSLGWTLSDVTRDKMIVAAKSAEGLGQYVELMETFFSSD